MNPENLKFLIPVHQHMTIVCLLSLWKTVVHFHSKFSFTILFLISHKMFCYTRCFVY